jgi:hypothetical protein
MTDDWSDAAPGTSDIREDEAASERASWEAIEECRHLDPPHHPTAWIAIVRRWGAAEAARRLLISGDFQPGFRRLIDARRVDLTVEWSALRPRWDRIFSDARRQAAARRLRQAGVEPGQVDP